MGGERPPTTRGSTAAVLLAALCLGATGALVHGGASEPVASTQVQLPGITDTVTLAPADPRSPAQADQGSPVEGLYEGHLDETGGLVHLVHTEEASVGVVETPTGLAWVTRAGDRLVPLPLEQAPVSAGAPMDTEQHPPSGAPTGLPSGDEASPADGTLQIMLDADRRFWADFTGYWEIRQLQIIHLVDAIYQVNLGVDIEVVDQHAWTTLPGYPLTSDRLCAGHPDLLRQFQGYWETTDPTLGDVREAAHLFTTREIEGSVVGCAYLAALESPWAYGVSQVSDSFTSPALYQDVVLTSHELGHNFDGRHRLSAGAVGCGSVTIMWPVLCFNNPTFNGAAGTAGGVCPEAGVDCATFGNAGRMRDHADDRI